MSRFALLMSFVLTLALFAAEPPLGTAIVHPVDGAIMVYVPAGPFLQAVAIRGAAAALPRGAPHACW